MPNEAKKKERVKQWEILKLRTDNNLSVPQMAKIIGVSPYTYGYKERGERPFTANEIHILCEHFGVSFKDIFLPSKSN